MPPSKSTEVSKISEQQVYQGVIAFEQTKLANALRALTAKQVAFLRMRAIADSDTEARHLLGKARPVGNEKRCGCSRDVPGWLDFREATVSQWKHDGEFMQAYQMLLYAPLMFAATRLEDLAPSAVEAYAAILDNPDSKDSDKRLAARDVLEAGGLLRGQGQEQGANAVQSSMEFQVARARLDRGLQLGDAQRQLLSAHGIDVPDNRGPANGRVIRTLDGADVILPDEVDAAVAEMSDAGER
jgi:hypothetical protein